MNLKHDPKEKDPRLIKVIEQAEMEAERIIPDELKGGLGYCHTLWAEKKIF